MVEIVSLNTCDRSTLLSMMEERWAHFYEPFAPPESTLDQLWVSPQAFVAVHDQKPIALFWHTHDSNRPPIFPLLHFFSLISPSDIHKELGVTMEDAWFSILAFTFSEKIQAQALAVSGYKGQVIHYWLSRLPVGNVYWIPKSRIDPRTGLITDYWEYVIHLEDWLKHALVNPAEAIMAG